MSNPNDKSGNAPKTPDEELKSLQLEEARLRVAKARHERKTSTREAKLRLQLSGMQVRSARLDLEKKERDGSRDRASADENLTYTFYEGVTDETIKPALAKLSEWNRRFRGRPVTIILNSPGGSVFAGVALYDFLQKMRADGHHVTVVCLGMAASMGGILLQAGDRRIIGANARVLIHAVSGGSRGNVYLMEDDLELSKALWEGLKVILAARSTLTVQQIEDRAHRKDWWISAQEAVKLGFADEVLAAPPFPTVTKQGSIRKQCKNCK